MQIQHAPFALGSAACSTKKADVKELSAGFHAKEITFILVYSFVASVERASRKTDVKAIGSVKV